MAMNDSITLTGDNADMIDGEVKDEVRFTVVGRITRKSVHEPYNPVPVSPGESDPEPEKGKKEESEVTISDLEVEDCEPCDESGEEDGGDSEDESGMPDAVKTVAEKM